MWSELWRKDVATAISTLGRSGASQMVFRIATAIGSS
jgi:hypothetical protein